MYTSKFQLELRNLYRQNLQVQQLIALVFMAATSLETERWMVLEELLKYIRHVMDDVASGRVQLDFSSEETTPTEIMEALGAIERVRPVFNAETLITFGDIERLEINISDCARIPNDLGELHPNYCKMVALYTYLAHVVLRIKDCYVQYRECGDDPPRARERIAPQLREIQKRLDSLENDPYFFDMVALDAKFISKIFSFQKGGGRALLAQVSDQSTGIDACLMGVVVSETHVMNTMGELVEKHCPVGTPTQKLSWFKKVSGELRKFFWSRHQKCILLLSLMETMLCGYTGRRWKDAAVKLTMLAREIEAQTPPAEDNVPRYSLSVVELVVTKLDPLPGISRLTIKPKNREQ